LRHANQLAMAKRNAAIPEDRRIEFRIGINVGDIIIDEGDIYGDGVNIAARVESLASPGAICLSDDAYKQVKGKLSLEVSDLGEQQLKNISEPVRVYSIRCHETPSLPTRKLPDKPSIAVLPFQNISGDPEQEYFCDGMAEDIITGLSRIKWLFIIARNSSFTYKGRAVDVKQVSRDLGVRYVVEGSVRKAGDRVRISAQVVEAETGIHVWAERYDRPLDDIFALQDEITLSVVGAIEPSLRAAIAHGRDDATALALGAFAVAMVEHDRVTAFEAFERAVALSPSSSLALFFGSVALAYGGEAERAIEWAERALRISPLDRWVMPPTTGWPSDISCAGVTKKRRMPAVARSNPIPAPACRTACWPHHWPSLVAWKKRKQSPSAC